MKFRRFAAPWRKRGFGDRAEKDTHIPPENNQACAGFGRDFAGNPLIALHTFSYF